MENKAEFDFSKWAKEFVKLKPLKRGKYQGQRLSAEEIEIEAAKRRENEK